MHRCPDATWRPLPESSYQPLIRPTQVIVHTAVDGKGRTDLWRYFARDDVTVESHFYVYRDGQAEQFMFTNQRADANRWANSRAISIETEDDGDPEGNPWTPAQIATLVKIIGWCCDTYKIPVRVCPAWDAPGIGYHALFGFKDPIKLSGILDNPWSTVRGKICPGRTRIRQFYDELLPALQGDDDMSKQDVERLEAKIDHAVKMLDNLVTVRHKQPLGKDGKPIPMPTEIVQVDTLISVRDLQRAVADLAKRIGQSSSPDPDTFARAVLECLGTDAAAKLARAIGKALAEDA